MLEKRRSNRSSLQIQLSISDIYNQDHLGIHDLESPIEVVDISTHGIGLVTECILPMDYYFNSSLLLHPQLPPIQTIVKIIRVDVLEKDTYMYGCEFTALTPEDRQAIELYNQNNS